tara:strand:+ start:1262 stop:1363 length:102 start_codon:yes stop_codon:yes gene_type:complete
MNNRSVMVCKIKGFKRDEPPPVLKTGAAKYSRA